MELSAPAAVFGMTAYVSVLCAALAYLSLLPGANPALRWWSGALAAFAANLLFTATVDTAWAVPAGTLHSTLLLAGLLALAGVLEFLSRKPSPPVLAGAGGVVVFFAVAAPTAGLDHPWGTVPPAWLGALALAAAGGLLLRHRGRRAGAGYRLVIIALMALSVAAAAQPWLMAGGAVSTLAVMVFGALTIMLPFALVVMVHQVERERLRAVRNDLRKVRRRLNASERRFRDFAEASSDWQWEMDADLRFSHFSKEFETASGIDPRMFLGKTRDEMARGDEAPMQKHLAELKARRAFRDFQYEVEDAKGKRRYLRVSGKPIHGAGKKFLGYRGVGSDVTERVEAEAKATLAMHRFLDVIENIPIGFLLCDNEDRVVVCNSRYREWFFPGAEDTVVPGTLFADVLKTCLKTGGHGIPKKQWPNWIKHRLKRHRDPGAPFEHGFKGGRSVRTFERRTRDGGIVSIHVDVTDLHRQKQELEKKSTHLEIVLEHMDQGISMVDADLRAVVSNEKFRELLEFPKELVGKNTDFEAFVRYNAERGEYGPGDVEELIKERVALAKQFKPHRFERTRPDGTVIEIRGNPVPGGGGFVTTYTDITERKRAEEALRENELRLALAMEGSNDGLWDWHIRADGIYFAPRLKTILGLKSDSAKFTSKAWRSRIHPDDLNIYKKVFVAHFKGETDHFEFEYRVRGDDGEYHWVRDRGLAVRDENGRVYRMAGSIGDISERKEAERVMLEAKEAAETANRTKGEFLANMSHELRTPLNAIIGFSEMMSREMFGPLGNQNYRDYARDIFESGSHLLNLINDILDVSKFEAGKIDLAERFVDVETVIDSSMRLVTERAESAGVSLYKSTQNGLVRLFADERRLKQILLNLLSNAVKFTPEGGKVTVTARANPRRGFVIKVIDTGIGISPENIERALSPFAQIDSRLDRKYEGTGLGLPLSRGLMELHGGKLALSSKEGAGTTVTITFPADRIAAERMAS